MKILIKLVVIFLTLLIVIFSIYNTFDNHGIISINRLDNMSEQNLFRVKNKDFTGFIDINGKPIIKIEKLSPYQYLKDDFHNGLAPVCEKPSQEFREENCVFINKEGKIAISSIFLNVGKFNNGLAPVRVDSIFSVRAYWGYINESGWFVIGAKYSSDANGFPRNFSEGLATVHTSENNDVKLEVIDTNGKVVIQPSPFFGDIYEFSEGLAVFATREEKSKYGFINTKGEIVIPSKYLRADSFSEGLAVVSNTIQDEFKDRRNYGYIDKDQNLVIPFLFDQAFHFSGGLAAVELDGKCGYINKFGKFEIPNIYRYCNSFSEDLAAVKIKDLWGYIDRNDKLIIPYRFSKALNFRGGLASVRDPSQSIGIKSEEYSYDYNDFDDAIDASYIDRKGMYVFQPKVE
ncbi:WG repeat-containing protein [Pseudanabaena sp. UWO310]|uniref:WG repeat-containing protein n=1 Tax=Pseudanabaena sp. UWO310 TaxID=2480795 RepID=UPI00115B72D1|nr:WG repeat-containing protein [Pseudanabaena sp. UWO310]TYQ29935.1 WG repeat-containing protein [Pseudanabaena sp. UWO310]